MASADASRGDIGTDPVPSRALVGAGGRGRKRAGLSSVADAASTVARQLAAEAKVAAREYLKPHHRLYLDNLVEGVRERGRTEMRLYPQIVGMLESHEDLADAMREFFAELRVSGREELAALVATARSARDSGIEDVRAQWLSLGRKLLAADPEFRRHTAQVLFGALSEAEVIESVVPAQEASS